MVAVYRYGKWAGQRRRGVTRAIASKVYGVLQMGVPYVLFARGVRWV